MSTPRKRAVVFCSMTRAKCPFNTSGSFNEEDGDFAFVVCSEDAAAVVVVVVVVVVLVAVCAAGAPVPVAAASTLPSSPFPAPLVQLLAASPAPAAVVAAAPLWSGSTARPNRSAPVTSWTKAMYSNMDDEAASAPLLAPLLAALPSGARAAPLRGVTGSPVSINTVTSTTVGSFLTTETASASDEVEDMDKGDFTGDLTGERWPGDVRGE